jgi:hypothetical protein
MPVVAQINVNFSNLEEIQNLSRSQRGFVQIQDKSVHPYNLARYCLYNREQENFGFDDATLIAYEGGFLTAGSRLNVKHSDLYVRENLDVGKNLYSEFIYSRRKKIGNDDYQDNRNLLPRSITISPNESEILNNFIKIDTNSTSSRQINLYTKRNEGDESSILISSTGNIEGERIDIISPLINLSRLNSLNGIINLNSFVNIANNLRINFNRFIVESSSGNTSILGNLNIGNSIEYNKFTVNSDNGNTAIDGTLTVNNISTFNNSIVLNGGSGENFIINNGAAVNRFTVNTNNGNTVIDGTLTVNNISTFNNSSIFNNNITLNGGTNIGFNLNNGASITTFQINTSNGNTFINGTLTVNDISTFNNSIVLNGGSGENFIINNGAGSNRFTVDTNNGNTVIDGTLIVNNISTFNKSIVLNGGSGENFIIKDSSNINRFTVNTNNGNTAIDGTLTVNNISTFNNSIVLNGGSGENFIINNGAAVNRFTVNTNNGNTVIDGTLTVNNISTFNNSINMAGGSGSTDSKKRITNIREISRAEIFGTTYNYDPLPVISFKNFIFDDSDELIITSNFTLKNTDHNRTYVCNNTSNITITCPPNLRIGLQVSFIRGNTGEVTFIKSGAASVNSSLNFKKLAFRYSAGTVYLGQQDTYYLFGDLLP